MQASLFTASLFTAAVWDAAVCAVWSRLGSGQGSVGVFVWGRATLNSWKRWYSLLKTGLLGGYIDVFNAKNVNIGPDN